MVVSQKQDHYFVYKAQSLIIFLLILSAGTIYFIFAIYWDPSKALFEQTLKETWKGVILDIPPIILALLLLDAFRRMRCM